MIFVYSMHCWCGMFQSDPYLNIGTDHQSWWIDHGIGCQPAENVTVTSDSYVPGCFLQFYYIEVIQAGVQCFLAVWNPSLFQYFVAWSENLSIFVDLCCMSLRNLYGHFHKMIVFPCLWGKVARKQITGVSKQVLVGRRYCLLFNCVNWGICCLQAVPLFMSGM